jgi:hypothetical protein
MSRGMLATPWLFGARGACRLTAGTDGSGHGNLDRHGRRQERHTNTFSRLVRHPFWTVAGAGAVWIRPGREIPYPLITPAGSPKFVEKRPASRRFAREIACYWKNRASAVAPGSYSSAFGVEHPTAPRSFWNRCFVEQRRHPMRYFLLAAVVVTAVVSQARAEAIYGLTNLQQLVTFDSSTRNVT